MIHFPAKALVLEGFLLGLPSNQLEAAGWRVVSPLV